MALSRKKNRSRSAAPVPADLVGKVFQVMSRDVRRCLICNCLLSPHSAAKHTGTVCTPTVGDLEADGGGERANW